MACPRLDGRGWVLYWEPKGGPLMAEQWIKMTTELHEKEEVLRIADALGLDEYAVVGRLHRLWSWVDKNSATGERVRVLDARIDRIVSQNSFAQALREVGWLEGEDGEATFPNFCRHNGSSAKARAQGARRAQTSRAQRDKNVTRPLPEKRRGEKKRENKTPPTPPAGGGSETDPEFEAWWSSYPKRQGRPSKGNKGEARREWDKLTPEQRDQVVEATARLVESGQMPKDAQRFLRPPRGQGDPTYLEWLRVDSGPTERPSAGSLSAGARRNLQDVPYEI